MKRLFLYVLFVITSMVVMTVQFWFASKVGLGLALARALDAKVILTPLGFSYSPGSINLVWGATSFVIVVLVSVAFGYWRQESGTIVNLSTVLFALIIGVIGVVLGGWVLDPPCDVVVYEHSWLAGERLAENCASQLGLEAIEEEPPTWTQEPREID
jgi:hypothetical protein